MLRSLVGSEMCIRDRFWTSRGHVVTWSQVPATTYDVELCRGAGGRNIDALRRGLTSAPAACFQNYHKDRPSPRGVCPLGSRWKTLHKQRSHAPGNTPNTPTAKSEKYAEKRININTYSLRVTNATQQIYLISTYVRQTGPPIVAKSIVYGRGTWYVAASHQT